MHKLPAALVLLFAMSCAHHPFHPQFAYETKQVEDFLVIKKTYPADGQTQIYLLAPDGKLHDTSKEFFVPSGELLYEHEQDASQTFIIPFLQKSRLYGL